MYFLGRTNRIAFIMDVQSEIEESRMTLIVFGLSYWHNGVWSRFGITSIVEFCQYCLEMPVGCRGRDIKEAFGSI